MSEFNLESTSIPIGLSLIEAGAGTGKTWTLSHLLPRLLIQGRLQTLDQVVLVTFTDDAAREACRTYGCYDQGNHSKAMKGHPASYIAKGSDWMLTVPGIKDAAALLKEVADEVITFTPLTNDSLLREKLLNMAVDAHRAFRCR